MKVLFAIKALSGIVGGAERVFADVSSGLGDQGIDITTLSFDRVEDKPFYPLNPKIRHIALGIGKTCCHSTIQETLSRMWRMRQVVRAEKPDLVVAFMHSMFIPVSFALIGTGTKIIASEHIVPQHYKERRFEYLLFAISSFFVKKITVLSEAIRKEYPFLIRKKMTVVPNPVKKTSRLADTTSDNVSTKTILSVGRLELQKDHETLIRAFASLAKEYSDWNLRIMGEGSLRAHLEKLINELGLEGRVQLPGTTEDIGAEYQKAQIFALSSRYESFGLATAEAMSHGLPVIGFADCPGTNELIEDMQTGLLVDSTDRVSCIAKGMEKLMASPELRKELAEKALGNHGAYSEQPVLKRWTEILQEVYQAP